MAELKRQGLIHEYSPNRFTCDVSRLREIVGL